MGLNTYFIPIQINIPHVTPNHGPGNISLKLVITGKNIVLQKNYIISQKTWRADREVMYSSKCFNYNCMELFLYETCEKLLWTSFKSCRNTNTFRKQGIPNINMNKTYSSSTLGFGCSPHKDNYDILSESFVSHIFQAYS